VHVLETRLTDAGEESLRIAGNEAMLIEPRIADALTPQQR
jgi:hypothetical protein